MRLRVRGPPPPPPDPMIFLWKTGDVTSGSGYVRGPPAIDAENNIIYFAAPGTTAAYAVDFSGDYIKKFFTGAAVSPEPPLAVESGILYFAYSYMTTNAMKAWAFSNPGPNVPDWTVNLSGIVTGVDSEAGIIYVGGGNTIHAFDASGTQQWAYTNAAAVGTPTVESGIVYFGDASSYIKAVDAGGLIWSHNTSTVDIFRNATLNGHQPPDVENGFVAIQGVKGAYGVDSGGIVWSQPSTYTSNFCAVAMESGVTYWVDAMIMNTVDITMSASALMATDVGGVTVWQRDDTDGFTPQAGQRPGAPTETPAYPAVIRGKNAGRKYVCMGALVSGVYGLYAVDAPTGAVDASLAFTSTTSGGAIHGKPVLHSGVVYFGCDDGFLYAVAQPG